MKDLTESLLTLARIEGGTVVRRRDPVDLRAIAAEAVTDVLPLARERGITVQFEGEATAIGDHVQLRILISNLVSNAVRYNQRDGEVSVRFRNAPGRVTLEVADTGPGLDAGQAAQVFTRFWRADASRSVRDGGTGLGLAISKAVVTAHGGTIACRPVVPHGIAFSVELPDDGAGRHDAAAAIER
jgi:two-component system OmpR family sensor kinase